MANITERKGKKGTSYLIRVCTGRDMYNRQIFKSMTYVPKETTPAKIRKEVELVARQFEDDVLHGKYLAGRDIKFKDYIDIWLKSDAKDLTVSQQEQYQDVINCHFMDTLGNKKMAAITSLELQGIEDKFEENGLKPWTIKRFFTVLSSVFSSACKHAVIDKNPVKGVHMPKISRDPSEIQYFDVWQARTFLKALDQSYTIARKSHTSTSPTGKIHPVAEYTQQFRFPLQTRVYMTIALYSGARREELIALTYKDCDFTRHTISISKAAVPSKSGTVIKEPKTKAGNRVIELPEQCFCLLTELRDYHIKVCSQVGSFWQGYRGKQFDCNPVFMQANGCHIDPHTPTHQFKRIIALYNSTVDDEDKLPEIHLHDLRHTSATLLIAKGIDIETIARRLGHAKVSVTLDTYGHALPTVDKTASAALADVLSDDGSDQLMTVSSAEKDLLTELRSCSGPAKAAEILALIRAKNKKS